MRGVSWIQPQWGYLNTVTIDGAWHCYTTINGVWHCSSWSTDSRISMIRQLTFKSSFESLRGISSLFTFVLSVSWGNFGQHCEGPNFARDHRMACMAWHGMATVKYESFKWIMQSVDSQPKCTSGSLSCAKVVTKYPRWNRRDLKYRDHPCALCTEKHI